MNTGNTNCWVLANFLIERGLDIMKKKDLLKKRFINLISNINNHFVNSFSNDSNNKKIVQFNQELNVFRKIFFW